MRTFRLQRGVTILEIFVCLAISLILFAVLFPMFGGQPRHSHASACMSGMKQQNFGLVMYRSDYDEWMPLPGGWVRELYPYTKNIGIFRCYEVTKQDPSGYGYALNDLTCGRSLAKEPHPESVIDLFESSNWSINAHDALASIAKPGRHAGLNYYGYVDGHVRPYKDGAKIPGL